MRQFRILAAACGLAFAFATASPVLAGAVSQEAQVATVKADSNLRSQPTTASPILAELQAGTTVDIICWAYGEPTYGTDAYGSMWLHASLGGWVHSFLVTPVEVGPCAAAGYGF
jgi:uncharacterized protein YraI